MTRPSRALSSLCSLSSIATATAMATVTVTPMPRSSHRQRRPHSRRPREGVGGGPSWSLDPDRLDLVADLDRVNDVLAGRELTEVGVLLIQEIGVAFDDEELRVVVEGRVLAARDPKCADLEGEVVVFARHPLAACAGAFRVTALHHPILDAMEGEAVVETASRFRDEALDRLRSLVGT